MLEGKTIGFIGGGNMAEAIIKGLVSGGGIGSEFISVAEPLPQRREFLSSEFAVEVSDDNQQVVRRVDILILAIKPQMAPGVLAGLEPVLTPDKLVISIMAGVSTASIEGSLANGVRVIRAMPNTPALIQAAATAICPGGTAAGHDLAIAREIFLRVGTVVTVTEKLMDAVTGLSGSGPGYVYTFVEALIDAGVKNGLPRDIAHELAVQTVLGSARIMAESGDHPGLLRDRVTSPGGTTIAGLHALESGRFRATIMDAVDTACRRSSELSG